jgi:carotenoid cleavage dioxygenase
MPREGGSDDVRWFDVEPCYVFHPMNAYDDGDTVVLDVVRHPRMFDSDGLIPLGGFRATLDRWTVDLGTRKVREERLDDRGQEFPRVDERLVGRRQRYGYSTAGFNARGADASPRASDTLLKRDFARGSVLERSFGKGWDVSEFVFEPSSVDAAEDDGVLMGFVYDATEGRSDLLLLDAGTLDTIAAIHLPDRVPAGAHGNWVPTGQ